MFTLGSVSVVESTQRLKAEIGIIVILLLPSNLTTVILLGRDTKQVVIRPR